MAAGQPVWKLDAAFGSGPSVAAPAWTDVSAWLDLAAGFSWSRGRQREADAVQPGKLTVTLDNADGRFTPGKPTLADGVTPHPYYPGLVVNLPLRLTCTLAGVTYPVQVAYADALPVAWENGYRSYVTITATDRFKLLTRRTLRSTLRETVLLDAPTAYYPMDEPAGGTAFASIAPSPQPPAQLLASKTGPGQVALAAVNSPLAGDPAGSAPHFAPGASSKYAITYLELSGRNTPNGPALNAARQFSLEAWVRFDEVTYGYALLYAYRPGDNNFVELYLDTSGILGFDNSFAGGNSIITHPTSVTAGVWHHVVAGNDVAAGRLTLALDGDYRYAAMATVPASTPLPNVEALAGLDSTTSTEQGYGLQGAMCHLAVYPTALSAQQIAAHYTAGRTGRLVNNNVTGRVAAIAAWTGIPATNLDPSNTTQVSAHDTNGKPTPDALADLAATEHGLLYFDAAGALRLRARGNIVNQTPAFTVDVQADGIDSATSFPLDDQLLANDVTLTRPGGGSARATDATSIAAYGVYAPGDRQLLLTTDGELLDAANYMLGQASQPQPRGDRVTLDPLTSPQLWPALLAADLGDEFTVTGLPAQAANPSAALLIEQYTASVSTDAATVTLDTAAADLTTYGILDDPVFGLLDNSVLFY